MMLIAFSNQASARGVHIAGLGPLRSLRVDRLIETFRWSGKSGFVRLGGHLDRLAASAAALGFPFKSRDATIMLADCAAGWHAGDPDRRVRLVLLRTGSLHIEYRPVGNPSAGLMRLCVAAERLDRNDPLLRHNTGRRDIHERAFAAATARGADEAVLLNRHGDVADAARHSLFVRKEGGLVTPPLEAGALPGILRAALIEVGRVSERSVTLSDLRAARALFVGNSLHGLRRARLAVIRAVASPNRGVFA
jgi:para-aminobenzoate synthetase/4-amino-4-deoxychorismate lyase